MKRTQSVLLCLAGAVCLSAPSQAQTKVAPTTATKKAATATTGTKRAPAAPAKPNLLNPKAFTAKAPDTYKVKMMTTKGEVLIQVTRSWAPLGADRFYNLVKAGYYDGDPFYRIVPGFVVQWGFTPRPDVNRAWANANLQDDPVTQSNRRGTITFATSGPNTRSTQLFINLAENQRLDGMGFSPFGEVVSGMDAIDKLNQEYGEQPQQDRLAMEGSSYFSKTFPNLDVIKGATIVTDATAPVANPGPAQVKKPTPRPAPKPAGH